MGKRDLIKEIAALRERQSIRPLTGLESRLVELEGLFEKRGQLAPELLRYFPIALVACIEAYTRARIKEIIEHGPPFIENLANMSLRDSKFDLDLIKAVGNRAVTLGELVSHLLQINNLEDLNSHLSSLSGKDFLAEVRTVHDRYRVKIEKQPARPIVSNPAETFSAVKRVFELRHMFAHEFLSIRREEADEIEVCFIHTVIFLRALKEFCDQLLYPDFPLTQAEMNEQAGVRLQRAEEELTSIVAQLTETFGGRRDQFLEVQEKWMAFKEAAVEFEADEYKGGTIWPTIYASVAFSAVKNRTEDLRTLLGHIKRRNM
jgi:uncharacterized protein YecT (DUF1311 family)